jgi:GNAT superfamily N-acetyltransferase
VCRALIGAAEGWLRERGMKAIRGPQNLPVNEATPGILTSGFDTRPVMYYHYSKPYYESLLLGAGFKPIKRVVSWEADVQRPIEDKLERLGQKIIDRYGITIEHWGKRPLKERKREMLDVYNDAWNDNFGFVPFEQDEFYRIVDDMQLIMDKDLFLFLYVKGELAAFFGGVPNVTEKMNPIPGLRRAELLRALKMILGKGRVKGFRLGYLGVKKKFRRLGLDGVMIWKQKQYAQKRGYSYCDMGWILEDNVLTLRLSEMVGGKLSKKYTILEKPIG